jgi:hypothetical protein
MSKRMYAVNEYGIKAWIKRTWRWFPLSAVAVAITYVVAHFVIKYW